VNHEALTVRMNGAIFVLFIPKWYIILELINVYHQQQQILLVSSTHAACID